VAVRVVRGAVCGSAQGIVRTVRTAVCGSVLGSVWQCAWQGAAIRQCGGVQQCAAVLQCVCGSAALCGSTAVWQCVRLCVAVHAAVVCVSVWQCVAVRTAVCGSALYVHIHNVAHTVYIGMPAMHVGAVRMSSIFLAYIITHITDRSI
jgi:hypothetical protein